MTKILRSTVLLLTLVSMLLFDSGATNIESGTAEIGKIMGTTGVETMTLCLNCSNTDGCESDSSPLEFEVPVDTCFSPTELYPDAGDVWGEYDILDTCNERGVKRVIFDSKNGTCLNATDTYILQYDKCLGPFGAPRPWGVFECVDSAN
ncbi:hypothetical protein TL16_g08828 [Triparma laevis f. inornata]|uniref:Uncharacterized protein n=2 Tax=Triparma laevis TaxID=1534972 RepID=A0A9W6ZPE6_9STRA|nr:hypothetical protein TrLO_g10009 [Triparma laevis f. longispina]GMH81110.1 hypothetical protein TL16_g08828 [Triparma laevis f. inornata]